MAASECFCCQAHRTRFHSHSAYVYSVSWYWYPLTVTSLLSPIKVIVHVWYLEPSICFHSITLSISLMKLTCAKFMWKGVRVLDISPQMWSGYVHAQEESLIGIHNLRCVMRNASQIICFCDAKWSLSRHKHITSKGMISRNVLYYQQVSCYSHSFVESLPNVYAHFNI